MSVEHPLGGGGGTPPTHLSNGFTFWLTGLSGSG